MNSRHITGPFQIVKDFEDALAIYTGAPYVVTTTSCTQALLMAVAYHLQVLERLEPNGVRVFSRRVSEGPHGPAPLAIRIPKRTYVGVAYAIREAGGRPVFIDEDWEGFYRLWPLPVWDCARLFTGGMYQQCAEGAECRSNMLCVSFHWSKTLGIQQGGAILLDDPVAAEWLRRARFDGRAEGVPPSTDPFPLYRAWHAYMAPETAAAGLVRLASLPKHNPPLPKDGYPDLSQLEVFQ